MMMVREISLVEKCKLVVWMDQFQCAELVQLRFKQEFNKVPPAITYIQEIHHKFMKTGSVLDNSETQSSYKCFKRVKEEEEEEAIIATVEMKDCEESEQIDFVSILKEEFSVEDEEYAEISVNEHGSKESLKSEDAGEFSCIHCGFKTSDKISFEMHQKAHKVKDFFRCSQCTFTSNSTSLFRSHKRTCTAKAPNGRTKDKVQHVSNPECFTCKQCGKAYSSSASLKMHQAYHSKLRPFACDKCDYRFFTEISLKKHLPTHDKIHHLECPYCSFRSNMSGNMIVHLRTHTGEKPFKCTECEYRTGNPNVFRRHMSTHRNELIYKCAQCHYKTDKKCLLANHEKGHSESKFRCQFCKTNFKNSYALRYHLTRYHSDQEVLECPFCDFRQKDKSLLKMHIRKHTGEKPYVCPHGNCSYRAIRSQDLKKHLSKEH